MAFLHCAITQLREKNKFVLTICSGISVGRKVAECPSCPSGGTSAARAFNLDGNHDDDGDDDGGDNDGNDNADGCDDDGDDGGEGVHRVIPVPPVLGGDDDDDGGL